MNKAHSWSTGEVFGYWTVVGNPTKNALRNTYLECRCVCGVVRSIALHALTSGRSRSCGCKRSSGVTKLPEYTVWEGMVDRCCNQNNKQFADYGGRGITMSESWRRNFENFYADMGPRPSSKHTIERDDNSLGYAKGNCRWATRAEQARNTSRSFLVTINGETKCAADWAAIARISESAFRNRVNRRWPESQLLGPPRTKGNRKKQSGYSVVKRGGA